MIGDSKTKYMGPGWPVVCAALEFGAAIELTQGSTWRSVAHVTGVSRKDQLTVHLSDVEGYAFTAKLVLVSGLTQLELSKPARSSHHLLVSAVPCDPLRGKWSCPTLPDTADPRAARLWFRFERVDMPERRRQFLQVMGNTKECNELELIDLHRRRYTGIKLARGTYTLTHREITA